MRVKMALYPEHDSDNSEPAEVNISQNDDGDIVLETSNPSRRLVFRKGDWETANRIISPKRS